MSVNVFERFRVPTIALAVSAVVAGCGGGGGSSSNEQDSVTSTAPSSTSTAVATTTTSTSTSTSTDADASTSSSSSTDTASQQPDTTVTVAAAGTTVDSTTTAPAIVVGGGIAVQTASARSGVGMNLNQISYYSPETPTIDLMKKASPWLTQCQSGVAACNALASPARAWDTLEESKLKLDANGWVTSLPAAGDTTASYRSVTTVVMSGNYQQVGKYVVTYDGSGTLSYGGAMSKSVSESAAGRDVVNVVNNGAAGWLTIQATNPANYVRNIRILPPGGVCANDMTVYAPSASACTTAKGAYTTFDKLPTTVVWHPQFLQDLKGSRVLRFMDWGQTNTNLITSWTARTSPTAHIWSDVAGVPVEAMLDLATQVGADPWINLPAHVDDDYVHQFAKLAHQKLAPQSVLNIEYGNEMWNYSFPATKWALTQAQTAFASQIAAGGNPYSMEVNWYAQRLVNVCQIVKGEFGADAGRVRCVANTQAAVASNTSQVLACTYAAPSLGKPCAKFIDAVAIAPYFAYYINTTKLLTTVASWYSDADGGLSKLFQEITGTDVNGQAVTPPLMAVGSGAPTGALSQIKSWEIATKAVTDSYGLPMVAYEGGQGMTSGGDPKLQALMLAANHDPRMGAAYQQMMQDWRSVGGQTFTFFTDVKTSGTSGLWGLKENQFDTTAPKWVAATQWRSTACWWSGC
jgi:hypothetical protein